MTVNRVKNACGWARRDFCNIGMLLKQTIVGKKKSRPVLYNIVRGKMQQECITAKRSGRLPEEAQQLVSQKSVLKLEKQD